MKGNAGWSRPVKRDTRKRARIAAAAAQIAVSKVAQSTRARASRGISSSSVFQNVSRRPELKFIDTIDSTGLVAGTGTGNVPVLLNGCAQGTDATQHIGRQTTMKSFYWMWQGSLAPTTTGTSSARLVILYDKEAEGAAPTIAAGAQTDAFSVDSIEAFNNLNNRDRFVTLVDELVECIGTAGPQSFMRKGYRKINLPCVFNASAAATVAAINTGSVYAFVWNSGTLGVANAPFTLQTRIRFEDA